MDESMTMNRVIHAAVRRDLGRLEAALAAVRDGDRDRARDLDRAFGYLHGELVRHHQGEDTHVFPMFAGFGVDPALLEAMESEHEAMAQALADTKAAMASYAGSGARSDADAARVSVQHTREVVERHLGHEERDLDPLLREHLGSPEWKAVEKQLRSQPPAVAGRFFAWVQDGMGDDERRYLSSTVPGPVRAVLGRVFGRGYHRDIAPVWRA
ncbi:MAG: hemerythrin domain-containing protein [Nocardioides sp.]